ncbi:hypothetical protein PsYK624_152760 [Phanerochaete sordida]|uniref:Uncharacterized protein n=1 Tax=Phanerochaete sordida TaxID=48140 RepID=A0A9P3GQ48_9APHY|nr:hypothetical protein PsYK624_152760 [Phanerochaete sordida]
MSRSQSPSDDEAPEAFSFGASKKSAEGEERALQQFHAAEKQKLKEKRRQKDRVLKERKAQSTGKGKGKAREIAFTEEDEESEAESAAPERDDLEARMERAMREAQAEMDEEDGDDDEDFEMGGMQSEEDEEDGSGQEEEVESADEEPSPAQSRTAQKKDYLPDHLFASAFSQLPSDDTPKSKSKSKKRAASPPTKKRKRVQKSAKDLVVGSRVVRTLPSQTARPSTTHPKGLAPPRAATKLVERTLNLRGDARAAKLRGWERRPANVGVMKRNGPAARFVRDD